ncbi:hypothetical protein JTB14_020421 [Gonioctena quinquepunctata]|nr:hypothetical protein JTB14_020421 [Gonioctena quinquepunctata]
MDRFSNDEYKDKPPGMNPLYVYRKINSSLYFIEEKYEPELNEFKQPKSKSVVTSGIATETKNTYDDNIWMGVGKKSESETESNTTEKDSVSDPVSEKNKKGIRSKNEAKSEISYGGRNSKSDHHFGTEKIDSIRSNTRKEEKMKLFLECRSVLE